MKIEERSSSVFGSRLVATAAVQFEVLYRMGWQKQNCVSVSLFWS